MVSTWIVHRQVVFLFFVLLVLVPFRNATTSPALRSVFIKGQDFVSRQTGESIVLTGPNVVVKGPPYLPVVSNDSGSYCNDIVNDECTQTGTCETCYTFNQADVDHIRDMGWNTIRLGVVW